jgi:hypothetical protein
VHWQLNGLRGDRPLLLVELTGGVSIKAQPAVMEVHAQEVSGVVVD